MEIDEETGCKRLVDAGAEDRYAKIQEQLEPTKIENILRRFTEGDTTALNAANGLYMDVSEMPTNLIEATKKIESIRASFEKLPAKVKEEFGNDPIRFLAEVNEGNGLQKLVELTKIEVPTKESEVTTDEPKQ